jgi:hypothetical protein
VQYRETKRKTSKQRKASAAILLLAYHIRDSR